MEGEPKFLSYFKRIVNPNAGKKKFRTNRKPFRNPEKRMRKTLTLIRLKPKRAMYGKGKKALDALKKIGVAKWK